MPDLQFFSGAFARSDESMPQARLVNMVFEKTPEGPFPSALMMRPGLKLANQPNTGPVRAMYKMNGVRGGNTLCVSGNTFFDLTTPIGTIGTSTGRCEIDASDNAVVVIDCAAGLAYSTFGGVWAQITDVDLPAVTSVAFYKGRWYYAAKDSSAFYWSAIGDPTSIDGLAFSNAEASPDKIVRVITSGDDLVFLGTNTVEFWYATSDPNQPVQPYTNRTFARGILDAESLAKADNTFMWIGEDGIPYRAESVPAPLLNPATGSGYQVVELIRDLFQGGLATVPYGWSMSFDGHVYYVLNLSGVCYACDLTMGNDWYEWDIEATYCSGVADPHLGGPSGHIYVPWGGQWQDEVTGAVTRISSTFAAVSDNPVRCDQIALIIRSAAEASVSMRYWDNATAGWSSWAATTTVNRIASWNRLGAMKAPGRYFEFSCADNQGVDLVGVKLNPERI